MINMKQIIFDLASHEKGLYQLGAFTCSDEEWLMKSLGDENNNFTNEDLISLTVSNINELIDEFIIYCGGE